MSTAASARTSFDLEDDLLRAHAAEAPSRAITWRSLLVGTIAVIIVCGLTPLNDLTLSDTSFSAGFLPLAAVLLSFVIVVVINAPLHRWAPRQALTTGELAIVLMMTLIACSIPNWGLMRFFIPTPVAPFELGNDDRFWKAFTDLGLPKWLFPVASVTEGRTDPAATWFYTRVPRGEHIPWTAWIVPLCAWGIFLAGMFAAQIAIARIVLTQWATNERLPYPLVQVQAALIESPEPGSSLNRLFRSPLLWIGLLGVFGIDLLVCLNAYFPRHFPTIPLRYDLSGIFSEEPLSFLRTELKKSTVSLSIIGVTFFIRSRAAFSLWATFLIMNLVDVQYGMRQGELTPAAPNDQHLGGSIAFLCAIAWLGRHHWMRVLRGALGMQGGDSAYRSTFWIAVVGVSLMFGWLCAMGVQPWVAGMIVLFILAAHVIVARVVAETGLPFFRSWITTNQVYTLLPTTSFTGRSIYFANVFNLLGIVSSRDSVATFTQHGLGVAESAGIDTRKQRGIGGVIAWTLVVGCLVAAVGTLWCQYSFPTPASMEARPARNYLGSKYFQERDVRNPQNDFSRGRFPGKSHSPAVHIATGFGIVAFLQFMSMRFAAWPLLPVGFIASHGTFGNAWFSVFLGWLAQLVVVRLGGASLFTRAKPFFIGIIFGEGLAAGVWLIVNAILVMNGYESKTVTFLL